MDRLFSQDRENSGLCSKELALTIPSRVLKTMRKNSFENIMEKGENTDKTAVSPFPTRFSTKGHISSFKLHLFCCLQMLLIGTSVYDKAFVFHIGIPCVNPFPRDKILEETILKAFAEQIKCNKNYHLCHR